MSEGYAERQLFMKIITLAQLTSALIVTRRQNVYMDVVDVEKDTLELDTFAREVSLPVTIELQFQVLYFR